MNYKLAKQLKDAGFPQPKYKPSLKWRGIRYKDCYAPTLSELIKACEYRRKIVLWKVRKSLWVVGIYKYGNEMYIDDYPIPSEEGKTPEEAVAKLWLKINNK